MARSGKAITTAMLAICALALGASTMAGARKEFFVPPGIIAPEMTKDTLSRSVSISVDGTLSSSFRRSELTKTNYLFGLSGFIIADIGTSKNKAKGEKLVMPLRSGLASLNTQALARQGIGDALSSIPWLAKAPIAVAGAIPKGGKTAILNQEQGDQVVFIDYSYGMSPQFDTFRLIETVWIANRALPPKTKAKPGKDPRLAPQALVYATAIVIETKLANAGNRLKEDNAANWAANDGEKLRKAVSDSFALSGELTRRALDLTQDQAIALGDPNKPGYFFEGVTARVVSQEGGNTVFWLGHFGAVRFIK